MTACFPAVRGRDAIGFASKRNTKGAAPWLAASTRSFSSAISARDPGGAAAEFRFAGGEPPHRHVRVLARQELRRAPGAHRVAQCRHLQREPRQDRRAVPEEGLQGLHRGPAPDAEVAGPERRGQVHDGSRDPALPRRTDASRRRGARAGRPATGAATSAARRRWRRAAVAAVRAAAAVRPRPTPRSSTTRFRSERSCPEALTEARHRDAVQIASRCRVMVGRARLTMESMQSRRGRQSIARKQRAPGITPRISPPALCQLSSARPFLPRGGVSDPAPVAAGGDRRPRRRNPMPRAIATRVRPPSRGAVRETRRHYDRLCVWRTVRRAGSRRTPRGEAMARRPESGTDGDKSPGGRVGLRPFPVLRRTELVPLSARHLTRPPLRGSRMAVSRAGNARGARRDAPRPPERMHDPAGSRRGHDATRPHGTREAGAECRPARRATSRWSRDTPRRARPRTA